MKNSKNYSCSIKGDMAFIENYKDTILENIMNNEFLLFLKKYNLNLKKVKILTALIFLNMSPLHINNFDKFLFLKSKLLLSELI